ncbi:thioesterase family protein [Bacillus sp. H-16]|uniref:thioesterase family protein n=1 Tax=Alteribacter salitolerans TaxID=2912333 RepID=UPI001963B243|nr:thioesterase family protein [Alteribacter salitolerans]MBM7095931.1 thioesterase family protein [Alteribacter salitolerans]
MKPGMKAGQEAAIDVVVTPEMYAQFEGNVVHPAYSTVTMVYHMEWAARQIILPYIEAHEEGIGAEVKVRHLSPTPAGEQLTVKATLTELVKNKIVCELEVKHGDTFAGKGEVTQFILPKKDLREKIEQAKTKSV